jgi:hypothetical protein
MRYWWVNQNQTFRHEIAGGYLWSPKRNKGNRLNPSQPARSGKMKLTAQRSKSPQ